jgi:hypothetical protein
MLTCRWLNVIKPHLQGLTSYTVAISKLYFEYSLFEGN